MTMQIPTASEMNAELIKKLFESAEAGMSLRNAMSTLEGNGLKYFNINANIETIIVEVLRRYFNALCSSLTKAYADNSPAVITLDESYFTFGQSHFDDGNQFLRSGLHRRLYDAHSGGIDLHKALILECTGCIPFFQIEADLRHSVENIKSEGLKLMSAALIKELYLDSIHRTAIRSKGRFLVAETYPCRGLGVHEKIRELRRIDQALIAIQNQSDIDFGDAVEGIIQHLGNCNHSELIPSRTCFGKGGDLEIHCFKEKYEFRFSHAGFDAIAAFVFMHGSDKNTETIAKITESIQAVA